MESFINESFLFNDIYLLNESRKNNYLDDSLIKDRNYLCPNCFLFPFIRFHDKFEIEVTCSCHYSKRMTIDEYLNPIENNCNNNLLSFSLDREDSFYKIKKIYIINQKINAKFIKKKINIIVLIVCSVFVKIVLKIIKYLILQNI